MSTPYHCKPSKIAYKLNSSLQWRYLLFVRLISMAMLTRNITAECVITQLDGFPPHPKITHHQEDWWFSTLKKRRNCFSQCVMCLRSGWSPTLKMMKPAHVRTHLRPGISSRVHVYKKQNKLWVMYGWAPPLWIKLQTQKLWKTKWKKKLVISDPSCKINTGTNTNSTPGTSAGLSPTLWVCFLNCSNGFHSFTQTKEEFRSL